MRRWDASDAPYDALLATREEDGLIYLALVGLLGVMTYEVHEMLAGVRG